MVTLGDNFSQKQAPKFYCEKCDYGTSKKYNYMAHILTDKHKMVTKGDNEGHKLAKLSSVMLVNKQQNTNDNTCIFICECGKEYKHRQGLWRHKKNAKTKH
jgi:hypothetical protein